MMVDGTDDTRLMSLVGAALAEADATGNTLVAAMLAECLDLMRRAR